MAQISEIEIVPKYPLLTASGSYHHLIMFFSIHRVPPRVYAPRFICLKNVRYLMLVEYCTKCLVILSNGSVVQVEANGNYHLTSSCGGSFAVGQDGTVLFTTKQDYSSTHIIRQRFA